MSTNLERNSSKVSLRKKEQYLDHGYIETFIDEDTGETVDIQRGITGIFAMTQDKGMKPSGEFFDGFKTVEEVKRCIEDYNKRKNKKRKFIKGFLVLPASKLIKIDN
jgi:hypothetical protein